MEIILLDQLGLGQGDSWTTALRWSITHAGKWLGRQHRRKDCVVEQLADGESGVDSPTPIRRKSRVHDRTELKAKSIEQSVRRVLRSRNPSLALERLATIEDNRCYHVGGGT